MSVSRVRISPSPPFCYSVARTLETLISGAEGGAVSNCRGPRPAQPGGVYLESSNLSLSAILLQRRSNSRDAHQRSRMLSGFPRSGSPPGAAGWGVSREFASLPLRQFGTASLELSRRSSAEPKAERVSNCRGPRPAQPGGVHLESSNLSLSAILLQRRSNSRDAHQRSRRRSGFKLSGSPTGAAGVGCISRVRISPSPPFCYSVARTLETLISAAEGGAVSDCRGPRPAQPGGVYLESSNLSLSAICYGVRLR